MMKQQRQTLTVYSLSQTVPTALDLIPSRFKILETNAVSQGFVNTATELITNVK